MRNVLRVKGQNLVSVNMYIRASSLYGTISEGTVVDP